MAYDISQGIELRDEETNLNLKSFSFKYKTLNSKFYTDIYVD